MLSFFPVVPICYHYTSVIPSFGHMSARRRDKDTGGESLVAARLVSGGSRITWRWLSSVKLSKETVGMEPS